jgi:hypothetical protein
MIIAFTGIRDIDPASIDVLARAVEAEFEHDPLELRFGGAIGSDTYALTAAWHARQPGSRTRLVVVVPFRLHDQPRFAASIADKYASEVRELKLSHMSKGAYFERNIALVQGAARVVAFTDGRRSGGTYHCMSVARKNGAELLVVPVRAKSTRPRTPL